MLAELGRRGHRVVDTDVGGWVDGSGPEPSRRADRLDALLTGHEDGLLFVAGCVANQGAFRFRRGRAVQRTAPDDPPPRRDAGGHDFGKPAAERARIVADHAAVEPLLRAAATVELDTRRPVGEVADDLERLGYSS